MELMMMMWPFKLVILYFHHYYYYYPSITSAVSYQHAIVTYDCVFLFPFLGLFYLYAL